MDMTTIETTRGYEISNSDVRMEVPVTVRLFGILALLTRERLVELTLSKGCTAGDVLSELGNRFGAEFLARILRVPGELRTYCALFVNGKQVDDLNTEIAADHAPAEVGVILFMASEGG
jgi:molybdopterin converting factor small subunit